MTILVWHRRDLRISDNPALSTACEQGIILPIFIFDPEILQRADTAPIRVQFLLDSLRELGEQYQRLGGQLVIRIGKPLEVLVQLVNEAQAQAIYFNEDIEPFARERDEKVRLLGKAQGFGVQSFQEVMLESPDTLRTQQKGIYGVFGPYSRNWFQQPKTTPYPTPEHITSPTGMESTPLPTLKELGLSLTIPTIAAGEQRAHALLDEFSDPHRIFAYDTQRNFPFVSGTSRLSAHLRMGTIGIRTVWQRTSELEADATSDEQLANLRVWQQELCWRDFYKYTLYHFPYVEHRPYQARFNTFSWDENQERFERWCQGETGYPLVDAAMKQLNQSGWMHNRCRMVVASFLCKDLLLDWRWGEQYFMQNLVDGDLAANNGGWQWSASVGTDPKPLRIFNPQTQLSKFDGEARYVRHWLPQLTRASQSDILQANHLSRYDYPAPLVDHKKQQELFKQRYNATRTTSTP